MNSRNSSYPVTDRVSRDTPYIATPSTVSTQQQASYRVTILRSTRTLATAFPEPAASAAILTFPISRTKMCESVLHVSGGGRDALEDPPQRIQRRLTFL
jgi:hypothetical protein